ncbi:MAG: DUF4423 domain-containing protein [Oligoflexus sp.]|nr:DUF4423 domain-containing protein [Oligoflexus sp.]
MNENVTSVRYDVDERLHQIFVVLDSAFCKKRRELIDVIVFNVEDKMKVLKESGAIQQFILYKSLLNQVWDRLEKTSELISTRVLVGTGVPKLKGLRITVTGDQASLKVYLPSGPKPDASWHWVWIEAAIKLLLAQQKVPGRIASSEVRFFVEKWLYANHESQTYNLNILGPTDSKEPYQFKIHSADGWAELIINSFDGLHIPNLEKKVHQEARRRLYQETKSHEMLIGDSIETLEKTIQDAQQSPMRLGLNLPLYLMIALRIPTIAAASKNDAIRVFYESAKKSLKSTPPDDRLFICATLGLTKDVWRELIAKNIGILRKISQTNIDREKSKKEYLIGIGSFSLTSHSKMGNVGYEKLDLKDRNSWLIWVVREMVKFSDFELNPQWIADNLAIHVEPSQIKMALDWMIDNKVIFFEENVNRYRLQANNLLTDVRPSGEAISRYYQEIYDLTPKICEHLDDSQYFLQFIRISLNQNDFLSLKDFFVKFSQKSLEAEDKVPFPEEIFHLSYLFFPVQEIKGDS